MNTLLRLLVLLLIGSYVAGAQQPDCATVGIVASGSSNTGTTHSWRIYVRNKGGKSLVVRFSPLDFHWKIEEASKQGWQEALTGGVGPGKPSIGASPSRGLDIRTILKHKRSLIGDFDVRRDTPDDETLKQGRQYRIIFSLDVTLLSDSRETACKLMAEPQSFRIRPSESR